MTDHRDPTAVFRAAVDALNAERWSEVAALCDPASLASFKRMLVGQYEPILPARTITADEYMKHQPDMPREVAEYHVAQHRKHLEPAHRLARDFAGVDSVDDLRAMSPAEVFARWLDGHSVRRMLTQQAERQQLPPETVARIASEPFPAYHYEPVGAVPDGERIAHVVYRHALDPGDVVIDDDDPDAARIRDEMARLSPEERELGEDLAAHGPVMTVTCRRQPDGSWRLIADYGFLNVGSMMVGPITPKPSSGGESAEQVS